ncbi:galectin-4-like [Gastrophryne carolinensis]
MDCEAGLRIVYTPTMPFRASFGEEFKRFIKLRGKVCDGCDNFTIDLVNGKTKEIVFHCRPYIKKCLIVRDTFQNGKWANTEKPFECKPMPFVEGKDFELVIRCEGDSFSVLSKGKAICSYKRYLKGTEIDLLEVFGDIKLYEVQL